MASTKLTMKLLIDTKREIVLFAEASKDVVDFLFNLLQMPLGTVVRLLSKKDVVGCLGNLYESVENLNETYLQPNQGKDVLLNPTIPVSSTVISGLLLSGDNNVHGQSTTPKLYQCSRCSSHTVTDIYNSRCSNCSYGDMTSEVKYISKNDVTDPSSTSSYAGFVKEVVTYMVMDDLVIQPMSTISSITLLNEFNVKDVGVLKEKVVELGMAEVCLLWPLIYKYI